MLLAANGSDGGGLERSEPIGDRLCGVRDGGVGQNLGGLLYIACQREKVNTQSLLCMGERGAKTEAGS